MISNIYAKKSFSKYIQLIPSHSAFYLHGRLRAHISVVRTLELSLLHVFPDLLVVSQHGFYANQLAKAPGRKGGSGRMAKGYSIKFTSTRKLHEGRIYCLLSRSTEKGSINTHRMMFGGWQEGGSFFNDKSRTKLNCDTGQERASKRPINRDSNTFRRERKYSYFCDHYSLG